MSPLYYVDFIGGDAPSVLFEFPLSRGSDVTRGGGEKPDTAPLGVCRSSPSPSGLRNLVLVFLFWGLVGGNPIGDTICNNISLSIGGPSPTSDIYVQLYLAWGSGKCAEIHKKFGPMDHWPLVLQSSGPPWARISHLQLSFQIDSPKPPELSIAPLRPRAARPTPPPPMKPYSAIFNLAVS